jgi:predicted N-acyltransferase
LPIVLEARVLRSLGDVPAAAWDALVGPQDPFTEHAFLALLERSGSVGSRHSGWLPLHIVVYDGERLVGAMPLYLKNHSYGEFIFDFGWAHAAMRAGLSYYPKLVSAVPMTPATGSRLLIAEGVDRARVQKALVETAMDVMRSSGASSLHVLFCTEEESRALSTLGLHARRSFQFHFESEGERCFDDFLARLRNSARKQVRRERERARAAGLRLSMRHAREVAPEDLSAMYRFYLSTIEEKGSVAYLTRGFFDELGTQAHAYLAMAHDDDEPVAGALFFYKGHSLYGRYWGASREVPMLHFELCYYLPMEWGFTRGLKRFEAGAQGEHKIKRGFLPSLCHSAHYLAHPALDRGVARFVEEEAISVQADLSFFAESSPFKRG